MLSLVILMTYDAAFLLTVHKLYNLFQTLSLSLYSQHKHLKYIAVTLHSREPDALCFRVEVPVLFFNGKATYDVHEDWC